MLYCGVVADASSLHGSQGAAGVCLCLLHLRLSLLPDVPGKAPFCVLWCVGLWSVELCWVVEC